MIAAEQEIHKIAEDAFRNAFAMIPALTDWDKRLLLTVGARLYVNGSLNTIRELKAKTIRSGS